MMISKEGDEDGQKRQFSKRLEDLIRGGGPSSLWLRLYERNFERLGQKLRLYTEAGIVPAMVSTNSGHGASQR